MTHGFAELLWVVSGALPSLEVTRGAVDLAARLPAPLAMRFVEDEAVLRAAGLPFFGRLVPGRARSEPIGAKGVEREWQALAQRARTDLQHEAERRRVACHFEVRRGEVARELAGARRQGAVELLAAAPAPARRSPTAPRVCVLLQGPTAEEPALQVAASLVAQPSQLELWVPDPAAWKALLGVPAARGARVCVQPAWEPSREGLRRILCLCTGGVLVLSASTPAAAHLRELSQRGGLPCWGLLTD